jgi:hypothetical protein
MERFFSNSAPSHVARDGHGTGEKSTSAWGELFSPEKRASFDQSDQLPACRQPFLKVLREGLPVIRSDL